MYEKLKYPASAMMITKEMIKIATFDLIPTNEINETLWYFPEEESFSASFDTAGVESQLFLQNIGLILYLVIFNIIYGVIHFLLLPCANLCKLSRKLVDKM